MISMSEANFNRTLIGLPFLAAALVLLVASFSGMFFSGGNSRSMQPSHRMGQTQINSAPSLSPSVVPSIQMGPQSSAR